jgi:hypothetical protein
MKDKKYIFELVLKDSESLQPIHSIYTRSDYDAEDILTALCDEDLLTCKQILSVDLTHMIKPKFAFYHKSTKLWVYFLPNYDQRQVVALGLKNDCTVFFEESKDYFTKFFKSCSFNGIKNYCRDNFLEFEIKEITNDK